MQPISFGTSRSQVQILPHSDQPHPSSVDFPQLSATASEASLSVFRSFLGGGRITPQHANAANGTG